MDAKNVALDASSDVEQWRTELLETLLRWILALGVVVAVPSMFVAARTGDWLVIPVDLVALGAIIVLLRARRLAYRARAWCFLVLAYLFGVGLLAAVGLVAQLYLLAVPVLATVLISWRVAVAATVANVVTLGIAATVLDRRLDAPAGTASEIASWVAIVANFAFVCWILSYSAGRLIARLERSFAHERHVAIEAARLAQAVEQSGDAIVLTGSDGAPVYANAAHAALVERIGPAAAAERLDEWRDESGDALRLPTAGHPGHEHPGHEWNGTVVVDDRLGDPRFLSVRATALLDANGDVAGAVVALRDISDERKVRERLRRSERLEALGTLASGTAHDFNNITAAIRLVAESIRERSADPELRSEADTIVEACERAGNVVRQMLLFGRESGLERGPIDLSSVVGDSLTLVRAGVPHGITVQVSIDVGGTVSANRAEVQQVVMNLVSNAVHAMTDPTGRADGVLRVELQHQPDGFVLEVADTGRGIAAQHLDRVFDPFFTTKAPGEGSGLGLASVHGLVTSLGGSVSIRSVPEPEPGHGTVVRVVLPEHAGLPEPAGPAPSPATPVSAARVLVVDDEAPIRRMVARHLEQRGYEVTTAGDGLEALRLFDAAPDSFDVVLTDLAMPRLDGPGLVRQLQDRRPGLPIVVSTGHFDVVEFDDPGVAPVLLPKPYSLVALVDAIGRALGCSE